MHVILYSFNSDIGDHKMFHLFIPCEASEDYIGNPDECERILNVSSIRGGSLSLNVLIIGCGHAVRTRTLT